MTERNVRERIIQTALDLFEKHGYHGVGVNKIIEESGTSKGGFYHNFKSKDELLYIIHDSFITYALDKAREAYEKWDTATERLHEIIKSFARVFHLYKPHTTVFYQESVYLAPEYSEAIKKKRHDYINILFRVVQEGVDSGEFRSNLPVPIVSMAISGMINWTYMWYQTSGRYSIDEIADIYSDLVFHAILTDDTKEVEDFSALFLPLHPNKDQRPAE
jgi:AcrR family transcriptional regulator